MLQKSGNVRRLNLCTLGWSRGAGALRVRTVMLPASVATSGLTGVGSEMEYP